MWRQLQRRGLWAAVGMAAAGWALGAMGADGGEPQAARQRLEVLERTTLPQVQAELRRHQRYCDTQLAVLHARRAMVMAEEGADGGVWLDMEVLTAQCHATEQQLRGQLQQLQTEQTQLRDLVRKRPAAQ